MEAYGQILSSLSVCIKWIELYWFIFKLWCSFTVHWQTIYLLSWTNKWNCTWFPLLCILSHLNCCWMSRTLQPTNYRTEAIEKYKWIFITYFDSIIELYLQSVERIESVNDSVVYNENFWKFFWQVFFGSKSVNNLLESQVW